MVITSIKRNRKANDKIYTPLPVAQKMIELCNIKPTDTVLDPCLGAGVFFNNLPECHKDWCEIDLGRDFFEVDCKIDCIVGNPPYSLWDKWLDHTMKLTNKFCYIFGVLNLTQSRLNKIFNQGFSITAFHIVDIEWWFGNSFIILFEKNKPSLITCELTRVYCDICGTNCGRGKKGKDYNVCAKQIQNEKPTEELVEELSEELVEPFF